MCVCVFSLTQKPICRTKVNKNVFQLQLRQRHAQGKRRRREEKKRRRKRSEGCQVECGCKQTKVLQAAPKACLMQHSVNCLSTIVYRLSTCCGQASSRSCLNCEQASRGCGQGLLVGAMVWGQGSGVSQVGCRGVARAVACRTRRINTAHWKRSKAKRSEAFDATCGTQAAAAAAATASQAFVIGRACHKETRHSTELELWAGSRLD